MEDGVEIFLSIPPSFPSQTKLRRKGGEGLGLAGYRMDIDLENVNEQVGTAIVDSATSEIKKTSGDLAKEDGPVICGHILRIIKVSLGFECIHSMLLSRYHNLSTSTVSSSLSSFTG